MRAALLSFATLLIGIGSAGACPHCNIFNYLAPSVMSSTNIFIGQVVRRVDDRKVEAEVVRVLRGNYKPHDRVVTEMYRAEGAETNQWIFSDPTSSPPTFEVLPPELEGEVVFLVRGRVLSKDPYEYELLEMDGGTRLNPKLAATNLMEAIKCVQGVSRLTQQVGKEFIRAHQNDAIQPLILELTTLKPRVVSSNGLVFGQHRLEGLLDALLCEPSREGANFALSQIGSFCAQPTSAPDWGKISRWPTAEGDYLRSLLVAAKQSSNVSNQLSAVLIRAYPNLNGRQLSEATSALILSDYESPMSLKEKLPKQGGVADCYALGVYWAAVEHSRWWAWKEARVLFECALQNSREPSLKLSISEDLKRCR